MLRITYTTNTYFSLMSFRKILTTDLHIAIIYTLLIICYHLKTYFILQIKIVNYKDLTIITNIKLDPGACTSNPGISASARALPFLSCTHNLSIGHTAGSSPSQRETTQP